MRSHPAVALLAAVAAAGCAGRTPAPTASNLRLEALARAFAAAPADPLRAAAELAAAGPGAGLERARLDLWLACLERAQAPPDAWRALLAAPPPAELRPRALLGLGAALARAGDPEADAILARAGQAGSAAADETLLTASAPALRMAAAARLAVTRPALLHRRDAALERRAVGGLDPSDRLARAAAWQATGQPRHAVRELESERFAGAAEWARRAQLALAEADASTPSRALRRLGTPAADDAVGWLARAELLRREAWARFPARSAAANFRRALVAARRAVAAGGDRERALQVVLECATEAGALDDAWAAWSDLEAAGWRGERRGWLGRRLGVALAQRGGASARVLSIAGALPDHERCLRYWAAAPGSPARRRLAEAAVPDLYGVWARRELGLPPPAPLHLAPPIGPGEPPPPVRRLLAWGAGDAARAEWRRVRKVRGAGPREALAAAVLDVGSGSGNGAIRWLLAGFPELGGVALDRVPADAVQAYLPLQWVAELRTAAAEFGIAAPLVAAVARQESAFQPHARSAAGAVGLLQLVPGTARGHARALGLPGRPDLRDPAVNLRLGTRELARLIARFGALEPALAGYNAGEARAAVWWRATPDPARFTEAIPIPETYGYVRRVVYLAEAYRLVYGPDLSGRP